MIERMNAPFITSRIEIDVPCVGIQWKNIEDVCLDLHCSCGKSTHFDVSTPYFLKCPYCGQNYMMGFTVAVQPVDEDEIWEVSRKYGQYHIGEIDPLA